MRTLGMYLSMPWGIVIFTVAVTVVFMIIGAIWWKVMDHLPEDELSWGDDNCFVLKEDDE